MVRPQLNTIVELESPKVKVLFSHENRKLHSTVVPVLKQFLSHELGREVEIVSRFNAWETLYTATDNVFDLVILARSYESADLTSRELIKKIKGLDQSIPVVQFSAKEEIQNEQVDGYLSFPKSRQELRSLTHYFRQFHRGMRKK